MKTLIVLGTVAVSLITGVVQFLQTPLVVNIQSWQSPSTVRGQAAVHNAPTGDTADSLLILADRPPPTNTGSPDCRTGSEPGCV